MADPNPVFDLGDPIWIQVIAVAETPPELAGYHGRHLSVPNTAVMPPLGTRGIVVVSGVHVPGYLRDGLGGYEWVMMPPVDPIDALVDSLPGPQGWSDAGARGTWLSIAGALRGYGVTGSDLAGGLPALYNAARANLLKEYGVS
jgi:hypothetical protein